VPVLYLTEQGSTLRKEGELFLVTKDDQELQKVQAVKVEQVVVLGNINLTTPVINYLLQEGIDCVFCNSYGKYHGRLLSNESKYGLLRQSQMETISDTHRKLAIAKEIVRGKFLNQRTLLMRYRRENDISSLDTAIRTFEDGLNKLERVADIGTLLGVEGNTAARYFEAFKELLKKDMGFNARVRRPPTDPVNSMLSFGYTLLAYNMQSAVSIVGLDPFLGCLHVTEYSRPSLVLDLMEEFRSIIVDSVVLRIVNNNILTEADFERPAPSTGSEQGEQGRMVALTQAAIKKFVHHYEERVQTVIQHPVTGHQVNYRRCFELQARQVGRVFLRQEATYKPFLVK